MAGLVDYPALILDLRGELQARESWGRGQVLGLINELEQRHRVDETADAAVLRRFGGHLHDSFMGILPAVTPGPLTGGDRAATSSVMDDGRDIAIPHQEDECRPTHHPSPSRAPALT